MTQGQAMLYRRGAGSVLNKGSRKVISWDNEGVGEEAHFRCPCDHRSVNIQAPPHTITFDAGGILSVGGSIGSRAGSYWKPGSDEREQWPENQCHFYIEGGEPRMCADARCPGGGAQG